MSEQSFADLLEVVHQYLGNLLNLLERTREDDLWRRLIAGRGQYMPTRTIRRL